MIDPFGKLEDSLAYMFELQTGETGHYISPVVQTLKKALDNYKNESENSLETLIAAVEKALPIIENYVDSYTVKITLEALVQMQESTH